MTNRERLIKTNEYDLLVKMQKCLFESNCRCILDTISDKYIACKSSCEECIREWLNKEEKDNG